MNTFLEFLSDNTFFAIFSGVIVVLVLAFIITLVKGKKDIKNVTNEETLDDNYKVQTSSVDENIIANNETNSFENSLMGSNSPDTGYQAAFTNYIPDLNEPEPSNIDIPETPIINPVEEVPYKEPIFPDVEKISTTSSSEEIPAIDIPSVTPEITIQSVEEGEKEVINDVIPDFGASNDKVSVEPIREETNTEEIEMPTPITETPELAFASAPSEDSFINENIKIDPVDEYDYEKTEIFDFPDFSKTEIDSKTALVDVESAVMEAANKYIESVMKS